MPDIKLIVSDLDRTLLRSDGTLSEYTKSVLRGCPEHGIVLAFATARPERATRLFQDGLPVSHVIANNGATVVSRGKEVFNAVIQSDTVNTLIRELRGCPGVRGITAEAGDFLYTNHEDISDWPNHDVWNPVYNDFSAPIHEKIVKLSAECVSGYVLTDILARYPELLLWPNSGEGWYQITDRRVSKSNAVILLCELLGITTAQVMAFGDDYNDVVMPESVMAQD